MQFMVLVVMAGALGLLEGAPVKQPRQFLYQLDSPSVRRYPVFFDRHMMTKKDRVRTMKEGGNPQWRTEQITLNDMARDATKFINSVETDRTRTPTSAATHMMKDAPTTTTTTMQAMTHMTTPKMTTEKTMPTTTTTQKTMPTTTTQKTMPTTTTQKTMPTTTTQKTTTQKATMTTTTEAGKGAARTESPGAAVAMKKGEAEVVDEQATEMNLVEPSEHPHHHTTEHTDHEHTIEHPHHHTTEHTDHEHTIEHPHHTEHPNHEHNTEHLSHHNEHPHPNHEHSTEHPHHHTEHPDHEHHTEHPDHEHHTEHPDLEHHQPHEHHMDQTEPAMEKEMMMNEGVVAMDGETEKEMVTMTPMDSATETHMEGEEMMVENSTHFITDIQEMTDTTEEAATEVPTLTEA